MKKAIKKSFFKSIKSMTAVVLLLLLFFGNYQIGEFSVNAEIGYGTGDWSNGVGWWSQGQSAYEIMRVYGCLIVAQAKMLVLSGVANSDANSFNPDVWYVWELNNGYVNDGLYTLDYAGPQAYASNIGKSLTYEGVVYPDGDNSLVWDNIYAGKYTILRTRDDNNSHYVLVNNSASIETGKIRVFQSWYSTSIPGTRDWENNTSEILTYSSSTPIYENLGSDFYAFIIKSDSWKHLAAENGNVQLSSTGNNSGDPKQIWHFVRQSTGTYKIVNEYDGKCLEAANSGTGNGTNVQVHTSNDSTAQRWFIYSKGGAYALSPQYTSMVMDIDDGLNDPGTNAQLWQPANTPAQVFSIYKLTQDGVTYSKPAKPSAVTVNASVSSDKVLSISWSQSPLNGYYDKRAYDVYIYKDTASGTPIHKKTGLTSTSYSYTLNTEGTYYVKVASVNTKYYEWYTLSSVVKVETKTDTLGDMDGDGSISVADALSALRVAAKLARATSSVMKIADVDFDGTITVSDALAILRVAAKLAGTKTLTVQSLSSCTLYPECYKTYKVSSNYGETHVEWSSSDASVASVGSNGRVTAKTAGTATITAKVIVIGQQKSVSFTVTVKNPGVVLSPATQNTSFDAYSDNRVVIGGHIAYKCPLPTVTTDVNEAYFGDSNQSVSAVTKQITSGDGKFSGGYFYSYQPGTIKIKYSFTLAGKTYSSTYTCNFTLTRTNPTQGQYIRSSTSTSSANLGMVPKGTTYVITQVAVTGTVGTSGCQVWGYTTYDGVSGWTLIEYWD